MTERGGQKSLQKLDAAIEVNVHSDIRTLREENERLTKELDDIDHHK
jgi:hypothetical protein